MLSTAEELCSGVVVFIGNCMCVWYMHTHTHAHTYLAPPCVLPLMCSACTPNNTFLLAGNSDSSWRNVVIAYTYYICVIFVWFVYVCVLCKRKGRKEKERGILTLCVQERLGEQNTKGSRGVCVCVCGSLSSHCITSPQRK